MQINDKFFYINIRDYLALGNDDKAGEPMLARVLSGFSCPMRKSCYHFTVTIVFHSLIPGRPHQMRRSRMSWYSF